MAMTAIRTPPRRHPWLDEFERAPMAAFGDLLAGYARIPPYERADAPDAARMLFGPLSSEDPARRLLGTAILDWLEQRRRQSPPANPARLQSWVREVCEAFEIVSLLDVSEAAIGLRRRFDEWNAWVARFVLAPSRDARAEYWRMLALTQPLVAKSGARNNPDSLAPHWVDICQAADSMLPHRYLRIGLLGLRRLQSALDGKDVPWVAGLMRWALACYPKPTEFQAEWRALKPMYPRTDQRWRQVVGHLLETTLFCADRDALLALWRGDSDIAPIAREGFHLRGEMLRSPGPDDARAVTDRIGESWDRIEPRIDMLMHQHRRFLSAASDPQYFVRAVHTLGRALIRTRADEPHARARKAEALAQEGLDWAPYDRHLWSLWREALEADGVLEAAELVGWESVRRDPNDVDARTQLATLLAEALGRPADAEALLRGTIATFPANVVARNQLAELVIAIGDVPAAEAIVNAAFAAGVVDGATYALRARLQAHRGQTEQALATLREGMGRFPDSISFLRDYERILTEGRTLRLERSAMAPRPVTVSPAPADPELETATRFGRLRRLRAVTDSADRAARDRAVAEIEAIFREDPTFAYAELLAARHRIWRAETTSLPSFAVAFEQALVDEDRARLDELAKQYDRLAALTLVAHALLGDEQAAWTVQALLNAAPAKNEARPVTILRARLKPIFAAANDLTAPEIFVTHRDAILQRLYDTNEAGLGDRLAA